MSLKLNKQTGIGLFGGTFDPVHMGHLKTAAELKKLFELKEMRMILSARPPHRDTPSSNPDHRLKMLKIALNGKEGKGLILDKIEYERIGLSYTLDTVIAVRSQAGPEVSICLCLGMDSFSSMDSWSDWKKLLNIVHIVVANRPGWEQPRNGAIYEVIKKHRATDTLDFHRSPSGKIFLTKFTPMCISSTAIRKGIAQKVSIRGLLPAEVAEYIQTNKLYQKI